MKKGLRTILVFLISAIAITVLWVVNSFLKEHKFIFYATGIEDKAFLNATWEMSEAEIERANSTELEQAKYDFFALPDTQYPKVLKMSRYKSRIQNDITIWGHEARVECAFFDDKLFEYTLFLDGFDADELHQQILKSISLKYGNGRTQNSGTYLQNMYWDTDLVHICYWLIEQEPTKQFSSKSFLAGVRFGYKPMFRKIEKISEEEHLSLF